MYSLDFLDSPELTLKDDRGGDSDGRSCQVERRLASLEMSQ